ncbi:MAG: hypothetical protein U0232_07125 [Thermomicrobiales bacterium]
MMLCLPQARCLYSETMLPVIGGSIVGAAADVASAGSGSALAQQLGDRAERVPIGLELADDLRQNGGILRRRADVEEQDRASAAVNAALSG